MGRSIRNWFVSREFENKETNFFKSVITTFFPTIPLPKKSSNNGLNIAKLFGISPLPNLCQVWTTVDTCAYLGLPNQQPLNEKSKKKNKKK